MRQQAQAEGLVPSARSVTGYHGVAHRPDKSKPFEAKVRRGGKNVHLGSFSTAEQAALVVVLSACQLGGASVHNNGLPITD